MAIASLICGIISVVLGLCFGLFCLGLVGLIPGIVALVTGNLGLRKADEMGGTGKGLAIAGMVLGGIGTVPSIVWLVLLGVSALTNSTTS
jgi:hypothetical protein